jgi:predicted RNA-binding Zn-ribbon protein involved in translation (DUF1610 family)
MAATVRIVRPVLTDEERAERMKKVDKCIVQFWHVLKATEKAQHEERERNRPKQDHTTTKKCQLCGMVFTTASGAAKFCPDCREDGLKIARKASYERQEKKRKAALQKEYEAGKIYTCDCCKKKIRVHGSTTRKVCDLCLQNMGKYGIKRMLERKYLEEEIVEDV